MTATAEKNADDLPSDLSFEDALAQLEDIVRRLESGDVPLDASISLYERGNKLRGYCQQRLNAAQARIEKIRVSADGRAAGSEAFDTES